MIENNAHETELALSILTPNKRVTVSLYFWYFRHLSGKSLSFERHYNNIERLAITADGNITHDIKASLPLFSSKV